MTIDVNIKDVNTFVHSEEFTQFVLNNTVDFGTAAFIFQVLFDAIDKYSADSVDEE